MFHEPIHGLATKQAVPIPSTLCQSSDEISCLPVICALQIDNPNLYVKLHALVSSLPSTIDQLQTDHSMCKLER